MLKDIFVKLARQNVIADAALKMAEALTYETQVGGLCLMVLGTGVGVAVGAVFVSYQTNGHWSCWPVLATGLGLAAAAGARLYVARKRIKAIRDLLTAKRVRDAVGSAVDKAQELARAGARSVRDDVSRLLSRESANKSK